MEMLRKVKFRCDNEDNPWQDGWYQGLHPTHGPMIENAEGRLLARVQDWQFVNTPDEDFAKAQAAKRGLREVRWRGDSGPPGDRRGWFPGFRKRKGDHLPQAIIEDEDGDIDVTSNFHFVNTPEEDGVACDSSST